LEKGLTEHADDKPLGYIKTPYRAKSFSEKLFLFDGLS
jgi:hypothetical protein